LVELTYTGDDGNIYAHALRVDPHNQEWLDLLAEGWDQSRLLDGTAEYKRQASADFNSQVNAAARQLAEEMLGMNLIREEKEKLLIEIENKEKQLIDLDKNVKITSKTIDNRIYDYIINVNEDKEEYD
jgi:hypothetical protein